MDLSQYAELFLAESREHLSACNQLLLEWERRPSAPEPVLLMSKRWRSWAVRASSACGSSSTHRM